MPDDQKADSDPEPVPVVQRDGELQVGSDALARVIRSYMEDGASFEDAVVKATTDAIGEIERAEADASDDYS